MQNKERKPIYSILIEHREIPLLAVLALLLVAVSIRVPGYLGKSWLKPYWPSPGRWRAS